MINTSPKVDIDGWNNEDDLLDDIDFDAEEEEIKDISG
jgi:hypothetical protein